MGRIIAHGNSGRFASAVLSVVTLGALFVFASCSDGLIDEQRRIIMEANRPIVTPADGITITAHETITFVFPKTMDAAAVSVSGTLGTFTPVWESRTLSNDTMILNGAGDISWTVGTEQTLDVTINTGGEALVYSYAYGVFRGMCVSKADPFPDDGILPDDSGLGTALQPLVSIPVGIVKAQTKYGNCSIHVAAETYGTDWNANAASRIIMAEGVSLIGGYAVGWQAQNAALYQTSIIDSSAAGGAALNDQNCAVSIGAGITSATVLEGFRIFGGLGSYTSAVIIVDASPIIRNCSIQAGGDGPDVFRYGVFITGTSSPVIQGCRINEQGGGGISLRQCCGIYCYNPTGYPVFSGNYIGAGTARSNSVGTPRTYAVYSSISSCIPTIEGNEINGGTAFNTYAVYTRLANQPISIINNLILSGDSAYTGVSYSLFVDGTQAMIRNNTIRCGDPVEYCANAYGLYLPSSANASVFENNIIVCLDGTSLYPKYGIYEVALPSGPGSVKNNDFVNFPNDASHTMYYDFNTTTELKTIATMETALNLENAGTASGNTDAVPVLDGSFHITDVNPTAVTQGGIDGGAVGWGFSTDKDGIARTGNGATGWSMGCYERN